MPCHDITDFLKVTLTQDDRLLSYKLAKRTCGAEVGNYSLISDWAVDRTAQEILDTEPVEFLTAHPPADETEEFLLLKHFFSLQNGLKSFLGLAPCGDQDPCTIDGVDYGLDEVEFRASLKVDLITSQIKSCGGCRSGCGTRQTV